MAASFVLAAAGTAHALAAGESPVSVESEGSLPWFGFGLSPKGLSRTEPSAAKLDLGFDFERGGFPPATHAPVSVELDRHLVFSGNGIPACRGLGVQGGVEPAADCRESIVGHGREAFAVAFSEAGPRHVSSPIVVYYGGRRDGRTKLYAIGNPDISTPSSLVVEIDLERIADGRFATEASFRVPRLAGGDGSLAAFELSLHKRFAYRGSRRSFISATCPDGKLEAVASASQLLPSGSEAPQEETEVRACTSESG